MRAQAHRRKAERISRSFAKLDPDDHEIMIDGAMLAISHWLNHALHRAGLTAIHDDVAHAYFVTAFDRQHFGLVIGPDYLDALDEIDTFRPLYVRGNVRGGAAAARRARTLLKRIERKALAG